MNLLQTCRSREHPNDSLLIANTYACTIPLLNFLWLYFLNNRSPIQSPSNSQQFLFQQAFFDILNIQLDSEAVRTKTIETRWNECEIIYISSTFLCLCHHCLIIRLNLNISKKAYCGKKYVSHQGIYLTISNNRAVFK